MTRNKRMVLVTGGLVGLALLGACSGWRHVPAPAAAAVAGTGRLKELVGRQTHAALAMETRMQAATPDAAPATTIKLTGDWTVTVVGARADGYDAACEIRDPRVSGTGFGDVRPADIESLQERLSQRIWVTYQPDGAALRMHFPRDMQDDARNLLEMVVTETQLVQPEQPAPQWTATERDGAGAYLALYTRRGSAIAKRKTAYVAADGAVAALNLAVPDAQITFHLAANGDLVSAQGREVTSIDTHMGAPALRVEVRVQLSQIRLARDTALVGSLERSAAMLVEQPIVTQRLSDEDARARADDRLIQGASFDAVATAARSGRLDEPGRARLEALVRRRPADIASAVALAREDASDGEMARAMLTALGRAGTPATQSALCRLAADRRAPLALRGESLKALVLPQHPTSATATALLAIADDTADQAELRRTALFVLGGVGRNGQSAGDGELVTAVGHWLLDRYASCQGDRCSDVMIALGNLATLEILPAVERALAGPDAGLRVDAARALRSIDDPAADRLIVATLAHDSAGQVRSAAIFAARSRPVTPLADALAHAVTADPSEAVRVDAVNALAEHLGEARSIDEAMTAAARQDPKPAVRRIAQAALDSRGSRPHG